MQIKMAPHQTYNFTSPVLGARIVLTKSIFFRVGVIFFWTCFSSIFFSHFHMNVCTRSKMLYFRQPCAEKFFQTIVSVPSFAFLNALFILCRLFLKKKKKMVALFYFIFLSFFFFRHTLDFFRLSSFPACTTYMYM